MFFMTCVEATKIKDTLQTSRSSFLKEKERNKQANSYGLVRWVLCEACKDRCDCIHDMSNPFWGIRVGF